MTRSHNIAPLGMLAVELALSGGLSVMPRSRSIAGAVLALFGLLVALNALVSGPRAFRGGWTGVFWLIFAGLLFVRSGVLVLYGPRRPASAAGRAGPRRPPAGSRRPAPRRPATGPGSFV